MKRSLDYLMNVDLESIKDDREELWGIMVDLLEACKEQDAEIDAHMKELDEAIDRMEKQRADMIETVRMLKDEVPIRLDPFEKKRGAK